MDELQKAPGVLKQMYGIDLAMEGECFCLGCGWMPAIRIHLLARFGLWEIPMGGGLIPLECCGTEFSFRFRNVTGDQPFRLDALTVYYERVGGVMSLVFVRPEAGGHGNLAIRRSGSGFPAGD
ncbi:hypothetical protein NB646_05800 [Oxalobacter aliiformigenes]|uniref:Uncharacterized protein n=1 Tax=Oxalobacter aliiformigenes TaxID=2946593 RepID=A0A9E9LCG2_9BURK|nr:hypothetical protein [Oxalobacter aliiformigenes]WAV90387.1 hypothetical protein NB646_05800 [Oxalobacter aliiformigenes]